MTDIGHCEMSPCRNGRRSDALLYNCMLVHRLCAALAAANAVKLEKLYDRATMRVVLHRWIVACA